MKQSAIESQNRPQHQQQQHPLLNVFSNRQVARNNRVVEPFVDALNLTDPCIRQSILSENPWKYGRPTMEKISTKQPGIGHNIHNEQHPPHVLEKRFIGPRISNPISHKFTQADVPLINQRPLQTISNTPRYQPRKQQETVTFYRNI